MAFSRAQEYEQNVNQLARVSRALAHPARIMILAQLEGGACTLAEMQEDHPLSRQTVSGHLSLLIDAGLVSVASYASAALYETEAREWPLQVRVVVRESRRRRRRLAA